MPQRCELLAGLMVEKIEIGKPVTSRAAKASMTRRRMIEDMVERLARGSAGSHSLIALLQRCQ